MNRQGQFVVQAYCTECGKLLMESNRLTKKQLYASWDRAVLGATSIKCEDCNLKAPNFRIDLKIVNKVTGHEYTPKEFIKVKVVPPSELFQKVAERWIKENPEIAAAMKEQLTSTGINEEGLKKIIEMRRKMHGKEGSDN